MKAIDTFYDNCYFRSRLEAKWAMFFNLSGIDYIYEPEGFTNGKEKYLPDFYLPNTYLRNKEFKGIYIEIKPKFYDIDNFTKSWFDLPLVLFCGTPDNFILGYDVKENGYQLFPNFDNYMSFFKCKKCGISKIEFSEGNYDICPVCQYSSNCEVLLDNAIQSITYRF